MSLRDDLINLCASISNGYTTGAQRTYIETIVDLCMGIDADVAINIGTWRGASALALASAMKLMCKPVSRVLTIDIDHGKWLKSRREVEQSFHKLGVEVMDIESVELDFKKVSPIMLVNPDPTLRSERFSYMIFYDIHDFTDGTGIPSSPAFVENWVSEINHAIIAVHDVTPCEAGYKVPDACGKPTSFSKAQHWQGQWFRGNGETEVFVDYLNEHKIPVKWTEEISTIWFEIGGKGVG